MREILGAEQTEFQSLVQNIENLQKDAFILTATASGISRWESLLKIAPDTSATLENRRSTVLAKWWNMTPYTKRTLKSRIATIQGSEDVGIRLSDDDPYLLIVTTHLEELGQINDLIYILQTMLPANMTYFIENIIEFQADSDIVGAGGVTTHSRFTVISDIDQNDYTNSEEEEVNEDG